MQRCDAPSLAGEGGGGRAGARRRSDQRTCVQTHHQQPFQLQTVVLVSVLAADASDGRQPRTRGRCCGR
eukprot:scaffold4781_cov339-Prasinococcus_capsulatus_cf.AAC.5